MNRIFVGDFSITLSTMDRSFRQEINKETLDLNYALDQTELVDIYAYIYIYITCHPTAAEDTFFSNTHGLFSRRAHMLELCMIQQSHFWKYI